MSLSAARLKRLVRYRAQVERIQEQRLGQAIRAHAERVARVAEARDERAAALAHEVGCDATELQTLIDYLVRIGREIAARTAAAAHAATVVESERTLLLEKSRDRKAIESMLEHRLDLDRRKRQRLETKRLDDVAGQRWRMGEEVTSE
jgi:flagellar export protein FliJ